MVEWRSDILEDVSSTFKFQAAESPTQAAEYIAQAERYTNAVAGEESNIKLASWIAANVMVQWELMVPKASPDLCLADENTTQHLPPHGSCGIYYAIYIVDPDPTKGSGGMDSPSVGCIKKRMQELLWRTRRNNKKPITLAIVNN